MTDHRISRTVLAALFVATTAALVARAVLQIQLAKQGIDAPFARDLSFLIIPVVLVLFLFPLWKSEKYFLASQFRRIDFTCRTVFIAVAIGVLLRAVWWSQLIARISFGLLQSDDTSRIEGPVFGFQCPAPIVLTIGLFVTALLTPLIEEAFHRAYVLSALRQRGAIVSILISAFVFAIFHTVTTWPFAFFAGVVLGTQYWIAGSLWPVVITHATVNGLILFDWRCFSGHWNPRGDVFPLLTPGLAASATLIACLITIYYLLRKMAIGTENAPITTH
jgi:membrane protease YdiL (CAAX protease family)